MHPHWKHVLPQWAQLPIYWEQISFVEQADRFNGGASTHGGSQSTWPNPTIPIVTNDWQLGPEGIMKLLIGFPQAWEEKWLSLNTCVQSTRENMLLLRIPTSDSLTYKRHGSVPAERWQGKHRLLHLCAYLWPHQETTLLPISVEAIVGSLGTFHSWSGKNTALQWYSCSEALSPEL